jgi:hypothetical protein
MRSIMVSTMAGSPVRTMLDSMVGGGDGFRIDVGVEFLDGFHPGEDFDAGMKGVEDLAGDGGGGDAADGFAGRGAAAAGRGADAVFGVVGVIGVAGAVFDGHFIVGPGVGRCCGRGWKWACRG